MYITFHHFCINNNGNDNSKELTSKIETDS